jgi:hypothetical protein
LLEQSIIEQKGFQDFMNALAVREGWLIKTRHMKKLAGQKPRKRYFVLKGDELVYYKEKGGSIQGTLNLKWFKKMDIKREGQFDDLNMTSRRATVDIGGGTKNYIDLIPDQTKKNNPAQAMRLSCVGSLAAEFVQDLVSCIFLNLEFRSNLLNRG